MKSRWLLMLPDAPVTATRMVLFQLRVRPGSSCFWAIVKVIGFARCGLSEEGGALSPRRPRGARPLPAPAGGPLDQKVGAPLCASIRANDAPRARRARRIAATGRGRGGERHRDCSAKRAKGGRRGRRRNRAFQAGPSDGVGVDRSTHVGHVVRQAEDAVWGSALGGRAHGGGGRGRLRANSDDHGARRRPPAGAGGATERRAHDQARARGRRRAGRACWWSG